MLPLSWALPRVVVLPSDASRASYQALAIKDGLFVFNCLAAAKTIVVKTERADLHGRYVTHLLYAGREVSIDTRFREGTHLNAELAEAGHAEIAV